MLFNLFIALTLEEKIKAVESVFQTLDREIAVFQQRSGLHCLAGCGKCCLKPDIEATVLEFMPFAYHCIEMALALTWRDKLDASGSTICEILNPLAMGGHCSEYAHRGLICRLFGYAVRANKYNKPELVTCATIKSELSVAYQQTVDEITTGTLVAPGMRAYYMQLHAIDDELSRKFHPINIAIRKAIDEVLHYFAYRDVG
ncbi:MAG: YkgJ family cysteine cluster protein [Bacteroidia bacterium]|nr:YkgJ family cysteine cluster protein [Bacteroidia bacterium]